MCVTLDADGVQQSEFLSQALSGSKEESSMAENLCPTYCVWLSTHPWLVKDEKLSWLGYICNSGRSYGPVSSWGPLVWKLLGWSQAQGLSQVNDTKKKKFLLEGNFLNTDQGQGVRWIMAKV